MEDVSSKSFYFLSEESPILAVFWASQRAMSTKKRFNQYARMQQKSSGSGLGDKLMVSHWMWHIIQCSQFSSVPTEKFHSSLHLYKDIGFFYCHI